MNAEPPKYISGPGQLPEPIPPASNPEQKLAFLKSHCKTYLLISSLLLYAAMFGTKAPPLPRQSHHRACAPAPPEPEPYAGEAVYLGCYPDAATARSLSGAQPDSFQSSPRHCVDRCGQAGYSLAGVKGATQCFCGSSLDPSTRKADEQSCNTSCPGRSDETCGQASFIGIYNISNPRTSSPASSKYFPDCSADPLCSNDVCNLGLSPKKRAAALVAAFTTEEKVANLFHNAPGVPRLGLGAYNWWAEGLHGLARSPGTTFGKENFTSATSFPSPIVIGAAFDDEMVEAIGKVISIETRAFDNDGRVGLDLWTPNINPFKDPRWGRGHETPGEDPFHLQSYVSALILGLEDKSTGTKNTIATCKHYAAYDFEEAGNVTRDGFDAIVTTQELSEYYLPPFKTCAADRQVGAFMCAYNAVNGVPACANSYLMKEILRRHWRWEADDHWVTSDCDAVKDIWSPHQYASTPAEASAAALKAGTDLHCIGGAWAGLMEARNQSLVTEADLDKALTRLYTSLVAIGFFDPATDQPLRKLGWDAVNTPEAQQLAYDTAVAGAVLIKNDGILPLGLEPLKKYALIGPYCNATVQLQGNYYGPAPYIISINQAAKELDLDFVSVQGSGIKSIDESYSAAIAAAEAADVILFFGGIDYTIEGEGLDRDDIAWPAPQLDLLRSLTSLGKPTVVTQFGGGQVDDTELLENATVNAILWAGYPGQSGGSAILNILTGKAAPAGRLPITQYPASYTDAVLPTDMNLRPTEGNAKHGRTHMWYKNAVVPFGHGLHYTTFSVSIESSLRSLNIQHLVSESDDWIQLLSKPVLTVPVNISNTGSVDSDFVAMLFMNTTAGSAPYPLKTLVSYKRAHAVRAEGRASVNLTIKLESLTRVDEMGNRVLYPGEYTFFVDVDRKATFQISLTGSLAIVEDFPQRS